MQFGRWCQHFAASCNVLFRVKEIPAEYGVAHRYISVQYLIQQIAVSNKESLVTYIPRTCFDLYDVVMRGGIYKGLQVQQILSKICMCRIKIQYC
jgi:hypothetical protein